MTEIGETLDIFAFDSGGGPRQQALDPEHSFIVQAPAGSGKTELLIQRYLALLPRVKQPESIVAITFTIKAAAEMRERIADMLRAAGRQQLPSAAHHAQTYRLAVAALEHSRQQHWDLLDNPGRMRIDTIDALNARLARSQPLVSGPAATGRVIERAESLYLEAARRTLSLLGTRQTGGREVGELLRHLDNQSHILEGLLVEMLSKRDQWLRVIGWAPARAGVRDALEDAWRGLIDGRIDELRSRIEERLQEELARLSAFAHDTAPGRCETLAEWQDIARMLLTKDGKWRRKLSVREGFARDQPEMKTRVMAAIDELQVDAGVGELLVATTKLPDPHYDERQWQALEALLTVLPLAAATLTMVFQQNGEHDFVEVALAADRTLGGETDPSDLALALDTRISHLLVDEFQDTSHGQFHLLAKLTAGWEPHDGRTVFLVGDPMQSIYRFREADLSLFLYARQHGLGSLTLVPLTLTTNYRSTATIVDWVNKTFVEVMPTQDDTARGAAAYVACRAGDTGARIGGTIVKIHTQAARDDQEEAHRVISIIRETLAAAPGESIAVLVHSRSHIETILPALRRARVDYQANEIDPLAESASTIDIVALSRALAHPADRIAWLAVLRAPYCGLSWADVHALTDAAHQRTIMELADDPEQTARLSADGRERLQRTMSILTRAWTERGRARFRDWVETTWLLLGGPATLPAQSALDDVDDFLDHLDRLEAGGTLWDSATLESSLAKMYTRPRTATEQSVQVMTIHHAKGLQFDTVLLPGLGRGPRGSGSGLIHWLELAGPGGRSDLLMAPIGARGEAADAMHQFLKTGEREKDELERTRLLYVATTRARSRLYLLGHTDMSKPRPKPESNSLLARIWPSVMPEFLSLAAVPPPVGDTTGLQIPPLARLPDGWARPPLPETVDATAAGFLPPAGRSVAPHFDWAGETAARVGTVVHGWLQRMAEDHHHVWDPARLKSLRPRFELELTGLGVPGNELGAASDRVLMALSNTLDDQRGRWLLSPHPEASCEHSVMGLIHGRLEQVVIDRSFLDPDGRRWIVDYKTSVHEGGSLQSFLDAEVERYRPQLHKYAALMSQLDPRPIRVALYFPLLREFRDWEPDV